MRLYFEDLRVILERHGGTVEKFVGDAVMAVFGIPVSHEDDALRAVRAAAQMRTAIAAHGLEARIGINTGGVVVGGEGETLVTGDAVNVAARLEQAAASGETLIGAETRLLVRDAVRIEAVEPLELKGKSEPVEAFRLLRCSTEPSPSPAVWRRRSSAESGSANVSGATTRMPLPTARADSSRSSGQPASGSRGSSRTSWSASATSRRPSWAVPLVRRGDHVLAARRDPDLGRGRSRVCHRHVAAGDAARLPAAPRGARG